MDINTSKALIILKTYLISFLIHHVSCTNTPPQTRGVVDWCLHLDAISKDINKQGVITKTEDQLTDEPFVLITPGDLYPPTGQVTVILVARKVFRSLVVQGRLVTSDTKTSLPIGQWKYPSDVTSCSSTNDTLFVHKTAIVNHVTLQWLPEKTDGIIQFRAVVTDKDNTEWIITSDPIHPSKDGHEQNRWHQKQQHSRQRRDIQEDENETTTTWMYGTTDNMTTEDYNTTTQGTTTDMMSYFNLLTIIGSYIGMYFIFAFLLL